MKVRKTMRTGVLAALALLCATSAHAAMLVDDFEGDESAKNKLGNRANVFIKAPSKAMVSPRKDKVQGKESQVLMLRYDKRNTGGPFDSGGWCGYYTLLKAPGRWWRRPRTTPTRSPRASSTWTAARTRRSASG